MGVIFHVMCLSKVKNIKQTNSRNLKYLLLFLKLHTSVLCTCTDSNVTLTVGLNFVGSETTELPILLGMILAK